MVLHDDVYRGAPGRDGFAVDGTNAIVVITVWLAAEYRGQVRAAVEVAGIGEIGLGGFLQFERPGGLVALPGELVEAGGGDLAVAIQAGGLQGERGRAEA